MRTYSPSPSDEIFAILAERYGLSIDRFLQTQKRDKLEAVRSGLTVKSKSPLYWGCVTAFQTLSGYLPSEMRYRIINVIKSVLRLGDSIRDYSTHGIVELHEIMAHLDSPAVKSYWNGYEGVLCLTHDIDYTAGYSFVSHLADMNSNYGIHATFNFLTAWDYKPEKKLLSALVDVGNEVGLHGFTHDIALGSRKRERVRHELKMALNELSYCSITGFRAPALSLSKNVLQALSEMGFLYDSSISGVNRHTGGILYCYPYKYPDTNVWEIPLSIQDTYFFRDKKLSDEEALDRTLTIINGIIALGGVAVLNCHPCIVKEHLHYYTNLLEYIAHLDGVWKPCLGDLAVYLERKTEAHV